MAQQSWTDTVEKFVKVKSIHFNELQDAINDWESAYSIANTVFSASAAQFEKINASLISEMQDALDDLYQLTDGSDFTWTERPSASNEFITKSIHINEIRDNMNFMQDNRCYNCDSCDTDACSCDQTCHGYSACSCNNTCNGQTCGCDSTCFEDDGKGGCSCDGTCFDQGCSCDQTCHGYSACSCNNTCFEDTCNNCNNSTYRYPW